MPNDERRLREYLEGEDCPVPEQCFSGLPEPHKHQRYSPKKIAKALLAVLDVQPYNARGATSTMQIHQESFRSYIIAAACKAIGIGENDD